MVPVHTLDTTWVILRVGPMMHESHILRALPRLHTLCTPMARVASGSTIFFDRRSSNGLGGDLKAIGTRVHSIQGLAHDSSCLTSDQ